jgi:hypothetical protein
MATADSFDPGADRSVTNRHPLRITATDRLGVVVAVALYMDAVGGAPIERAEIDEPIMINRRDSLEFEPGALRFEPKEQE